MHIKEYKPHIDGLRALAVLPVIFFHAGFDLFKGGFIGVDIFFVISGYLITNIIIKDLYENKFNLSNFYIRRSRRILPVLFFVTLSSIIASIFLMSAEEIKFFSRQAISVVLFYQIFFSGKILVILIRIQNYNLYYIHGVLVLRNNFIFSFLYS